MTQRTDSWGVPWYVTLQIAAGALMAVSSVLLIALADGPHWPSWITLAIGLGMVCRAGFETLQSRRRVRAAEEPPVVNS